MYRDSILQGILLSFFFIPSLSIGQGGFTEIALSLGINKPYDSNMNMGGGTAILDFDQDGWEDLYLTMGYASDQLWRNNGDGTFTDVSVSSGVNVTSSAPTTGVVSGDIDNDGFRELFITSDTGYTNFLFFNNGDGTFTDITLSAGITFNGMAYSPAFADLNKDGYLDLYIVNYIDKDSYIEDSTGELIGFDHSCFPNSYYQNNGDLTFTEIGDFAGVSDTGCGLAITITDFDDDGDGDIFAINDFGEWVVPNRMYRNEYPLPDSFTEVSASINVDSRIFGMGVAIGDYDHDMDLDYYITNLGRNILLNNQTGVYFEDTTTFAGVENGTHDTLLTTGWGTAFIDYDNDRWQDLVISNGFITSVDFIATHPDDPDKLYKNNGDGTFTDVSDSLGFNNTKVNRGLGWFDYDQDGDQDVVVLMQSDDTTALDHNLFYRNDITNSNHWLQVKLQGRYSNRDAYGARLRVWSGGEGWMYEVNGGSSHLSQNSSILHIGLGTETLVDSLRILWPNGLEETLYGLPADNRICVIEDSTWSIITHKNFKRVENQTRLHAWPCPFSEELNIEIGTGHAENYEISICDVQGRIVRRLSHGTASTQIRREVWNGKNEHGETVATGLYFIFFQTPVETKCLKVIKRN